MLRDHDPRLVSGRMSRHSQDPTSPNHIILLDHQRLAARNLALTRPNAGRRPHLSKKKTASAHKHMHMHIGQLLRACLQSRASRPDGSPTAALQRRIVPALPVRLFCVAPPWFALRPAPPISWTDEMIDRRRASPRPCGL